MSELEQEASQWVPPWQRQAPASPDEQAPEDDFATESDGAPAAVLEVELPGDPVEPEAELSAEDLIEPEVKAKPRWFSENTGIWDTLRAEVGQPKQEEDDWPPRRSDSDGSGPIAAPIGVPSQVAGPSQAGPEAFRSPELAEAWARAEAAEQAAAAGWRPIEPQVEEPEKATTAAAVQFVLTDQDLVPALEAILMVVDEPVSEIVLSQVLEVPAEQIAMVLIDLSAAYTKEGRGFELRRAAGGWRFYTRAEYSSFVEKFVLDGQSLRLTQASLETLAVIAYKQPVTRSRIAAIRGVNSDGVIRTLMTRGMIEDCGIEPESGAHLYRTTTLFLEKLGLDSVDQLPPLAPFLPDNVEEIANEQTL